MSGLESWEGNVNPVFMITRPLGKTMNKIAIFGTSGFAREVADICIDQGYQEVVLLSDSDEEDVALNGLSVIQEEAVDSLSQQGFKFAIGIGDSRVRNKVQRKYKHLDFPNLVHSSVIMGAGQRQRLDKTVGNILAAGCIFTNSIRFGNFGVFNLKTTVGHDCILGDFVSIMPNVSISGNVEIKNSVFIGVSATILQGKDSRKLILGESALVGAHSLVTKNVRANTTVFGVPAKKLN